MLINKIDGVVCCPFCGSQDLSVNYYGIKKVEVSGYIDSSLCENEFDSEYYDDDYSYEMECCGTAISYNDIEDIYDGRYEMTDDRMQNWEEDSETSIKSNINTIELLLKK